jgi:hypothetical protein
MKDLRRKSALDRLQIQLQENVKTVKKSFTDKVELDKGDVVSIHKNIENIKKKLK